MFFSIINDLNDIHYSRAESRFIFVKKSDREAAS